MCSLQLVLLASCLHMFLSIFTAAASHLIPSKSLQASLPLHKIWKLIIAFCKVMNRFWAIWVRIQRWIDFAALHYWEPLLSLHQIQPSGQLGRNTFVFFHLQNQLFCWRNNQNFGDSRQNQWAIPALHLEPLEALHFKDLLARNFFITTVTNKIDSKNYMYISTLFK